MGEMPRLTNTDPWQIMQAFANEGNRYQGRYGRNNAALNNAMTSLDHTQDAMQDAAEDGPSGGGNQAYQDAMQDYIQDSPDYSSPQPAPQASDYDKPIPLAGAAPTNVQAMINKAASDQGVDPQLFSRLVEQESSYNPNATSKVGAHGLAQLMPGTAKMLGVNINDPQDNLEGGAKYLKQNLDHFNGDTGRALAGYNWGTGNVDKWVARGANPQNAPAETRGYVKKITGQDLAMNDAKQDASQDAADANVDNVDPSSRLSWLV